MVEVLFKDSWYKYVGFNGVIVGMDIFGEFVFVGDLFKYFNIIIDVVVEVVLFL